MTNTQLILLCRTITDCVSAIVQSNLYPDSPDGAQRAMDRADDRINDHEKTYLRKADSLDEYESSTKPLF